MNKKLKKLLSIIFIVTILFSINTFSNATNLNVNVKTQDFIYAKSRQVTRKQSNF